MCECVCAMMSPVTSSEGHSVSSSSKRAPLALVVVLALCVIGVAAFLFLQPREQDQNATDTEPESSLSPLADPGVAETVVEVLRNFPENPLAHTSSAMQETVSANLTTVLPEGSTLDADPTTWQPVGADSGSIVMTMLVPGESDPRLYIAFLILEDGKWKLDGTVSSEASS